MESKVINKIKKLSSKEYSLTKWDLIALLLIIFVFSGIFGFIYETLFYRIDLGYFVKRGTTYGPWIPIYGFGGVFITLVTYKFRKKPALVFILGTLVSGILEFATGYLLFHISGIRLWDYNTEIWNWGNIGGYICLRSVLFFGISGLFLIYFVNPIIKLFMTKIPKPVYYITALLFGSAFAFDIILSNIL